MKGCLTLLFMLFCFVTHFSSAQLNPEQNAEAELYRNNMVKTIKFYEYRTAKRHGKGKLTAYTRLDTLGREIETWSHLKLSLFRSTNYRVLYEYNENGDLSKRISYVIEGSDPVIETYTYKYNEQQKITYKKKNAFSGELWEHSYDSLGNRIRTRWYMSDDTLNNAFFFIDSFYYAGNRLQVMKRFRPDNSVYFYFEYEYDEHGNLIGEIRHEKGRITDIWKYTCDEEGKRIHHMYTDLLTGRTSDSETEYTDEGLRTFHKGKRRIVYEYYFID